MALKKTLLFSLFLHGILLILLLGFFHPFKSPPIGTVKIFNAHLAIKSGLLLRQQRLSEMKQSLQHIKQDKQMIEKKGIPLKNEWAKRSKTAVIAFKENGDKNALMILLHNLISQHQQYPQRAVLLRQTGNIEVGFTLSPAGEVSHVQVLNSSHFASLDTAAIQAVEAINPVLDAHLYLQKEKSLRVWIRFQTTPS
jgi:TonB family protein